MRISRRRAANSNRTERRHEISLWFRQLTTGVTDEPKRRPLLEAKGEKGSILYYHNYNVPINLQATMIRLSFHSVSCLLLRVCRLFSFHFFLSFFPFQPQRHARHNLLCCQSPALLCDVECVSLWFISVSWDRISGFVTRVKLFISFPRGPTDTSTFTMMDSVSVSLCQMNLHTAAGWCCMVGRGIPQIIHLVFFLV